MKRNSTCRWTLISTHRETGSRSAHDSEQADDSPHQRLQALRYLIQDTGGPYHENTNWGYCYRLAQGRKAIARFLKTILWLQGRADSTRWTDIKTIENSYPSCHEIRNETNISLWPSRHKLQSQKSEGPDILARHVCQNTTICTSLCHLCNICNPQTAEPVIATEVPKRSWQQIAADILPWGGDEYLVTVDQHSKFFEVDKPNNSTSDAVIGHLRSHFVRLSHFKQRTPFLI